MYEKKKEISKNIITPPRVLLAHVMEFESAVPEYSGSNPEEGIKTRARDKFPYKYLFLFDFQIGKISIFKNVKFSLGNRRITKSLFEFGSHEMLISILHISFILIYIISN